MPFLQKRPKLTARWCSCQACPCDGPLWATWRAPQRECQGRVSPLGWRSPTSAPQMTSCWQESRHVYTDIVIRRVTAEQQNESAVSLFCTLFKSWHLTKISGVSGHFLPSSSLRCSQWYSGPALNDVFCAWLASHRLALSDHTTPKKTLDHPQQTKE